MSRSARRRVNRLTAATLTTLCAAGAVPVAAEAGLIAAYDKYVQGKGFDIALVDANSGASVAVPVGVNTSADEFHPALTKDGTRLVFTRATLQPQLNGDIVPPSARTVLMADRTSTPNVRDAFEGLPGLAGAGATIVPIFDGRQTLAVGLRHKPSEPSSTVVEAGTLRTDGSAFTPAPFFRTLASEITAPPPSQFNDFPQVAVVGKNGSRLKVRNDVRFDGGNGTTVASSLNFLNQVFNSSGTTTATFEFGILGLGFPRHPASRVGDGHTAFDSLVNGQREIKTIQIPGDTSSNLAPSPINTAAAEEMPAWSPDGVKLGFVRTSNGNRSLLVFDNTQGLQTIVNPSVGLGKEAPTPQLRNFHSVWGGLSLASTAGGQTLTCTSLCEAQLAAGTTSTAPVQLSPSIGGTSSTGGKVSTIGIFVARVLGTRKVLGRSVPRVGAVGRVPLGAARSARLQHFRWNGRVNGRRLPAGTYLLTFRGLNRRGRVLATSRSIRFTLTRSGQIRNVRTLR
jgi:hypothetical protein